MLAALFLAHSHGSRMACLHSWDYNASVDMQCHDLDPYKYHIIGYGSFVVGLSLGSLLLHYYFQTQIINQSLGAVSFAVLLPCIKFTVLYAYCNLPFWMKKEASTRKPQDAGFFLEILYLNFPCGKLTRDFLVILADYDSLEERV